MRLRLDDKRINELEEGLALQGHEWFWNRIGRHMTENFMDGVVTLDEFREDLAEKDNAERLARDLGVEDRAATEVLRLLKERCGSA